MIHLVTGGAGFIGSHLVDALVENGHEVVVVDSLVTGSRANLASHLGSGAVRLVEADLLGGGWQESLSGVDRVWHLAADPDVRQSAIDPANQVKSHVIATQRLLDEMRKASVREIAYTSTSTVYGEATVIPTPETYTPFEPISVYGGCKLAAEALISAYSHSFGMRSWIYRFANIIGPRGSHGVILDFIRKLRKDPRTLEILGDGNQIKSYLDVRECVRAMLFVAGRTGAPVNTFNIGSEDWITVRRIAEIVVEEMDLPDVSFRYTGGERGWIGDVPKMQLSIGRLKTLGWTPGSGSEECVRAATRALLDEGVQ
ncbi:MAG: NAD-dependent epimerase/dehydratase family protein [Methanoregulaceae archaeon]|nr:NAD-dependent epimerase/dehydratase family protein [Methanoregulaceae archaeon]